jgi:hypothetical protein
VGGSVTKPIQIDRRVGDLRSVLGDTVEALEVR